MVSARPDPAQAGEQQLQGCGGFDHTELQDLSGLIPGGWASRASSGTGSLGKNKQFLSGGTKDRARSRKGVGVHLRGWPCQGPWEGGGEAGTVSFVPR